MATKPSSTSVNVAQSLAQSFIVGAVEHVDPHVVQPRDEPLPDHFVKALADVVLDLFGEQIAEAVVVQLQPVEADDREVVR